jgi:hypothetical protein
MNRVFACHDNSLFLVCFSGYPLPKLVWLSADPDGFGSVTDASYATTASGDATENYLNIKSLARRYFGRTFTCMASNNNATKAVATNVTIDMRRKLNSLFTKSVDIPIIPQQLASGPV